MRFHYDIKWRMKKTTAMPTGPTLAPELGPTLSNQESNPTITYKPEAEAGNEQEEIMNENQPQPKETHNFQITTTNTFQGLPNGSTNISTPTRQDL